MARYLTRCHAAIGALLILAQPYQGVASPNLKTSSNVSPKSYAAAAPISHATLRKVNVSICLAGRFAPSFLKPAIIKNLATNLFEPLDADIYVVTSTERGGANHREHAVGITGKRLQQIFGARLKGHIIRSGGQMTSSWNVSRMLKDSELRSFRLLPYLLNILGCRDLVFPTDNIASYDVVVRMRPDLAVLRPFQIQFSPTYGRFRLSVGHMTHSEFGDGDVIINSFTWECGNDWLAIGTASQMYRSMSILPHLVQNTFYLPCNALHNSANAVEKELSQTGTEHFHDRFWFATTTKVVRMPLGIELARTSCMQMGCLRQSPFTRLSTFAHEKIGVTFGTEGSMLDCASCSVGPHGKTCQEKLYFQNKTSCYTDRVSEYSTYAARER